MQTKPQGVVLYHGPSILDRTPIFAVITNLVRRTKNAKTGDAAQVFILGDNDADPVEAHLSGEDYAICGDCPHRELHTCYVNLVQSPLQVWKSFQRGLYPVYDRESHADLIRGRFVRLGAYGDPAAVPLRVWKEVCELSSHWTGYTHQWRECSARYASFLMASVESEFEARQAQSLGYRTFRTRLKDQPLMKGEIICPAAEEGGRRMTCERCGACRGKLKSPLAASVAVVFHGPQIAGNWQLGRYTKYLSSLPVIS